MDRTTNTTNIENVEQLTIFKVPGIKARRGTGLVPVNAGDCGSWNRHGAANTFLAAEKFFSSKKSSQLEKCSLVVKAVW